MELQCSPANPDMRYSGQRGNPDSESRVNRQHWSTSGSGSHTHWTYQEPVLYFRYLLE